MAINYDATIFAPNINARIFLDRIFLDRIFLAYIGFVNLCCVLFSRASFFYMFLPVSEGTGRENLNVLIIWWLLSIFISC